MRLVTSQAVLKKLTEKHRVTKAEVVQAFENRSGGLLRDTREEHLTDPPTLWFVANTDSGRTLKIAYVQRGELTFLKTAYDANDDEKQIYLDKFGAYE
jgi:hypothetical protein